MNLLSVRALTVAAVVGAMASVASAQVQTLPTMDPTLLSAALGGNGVRITSVSVHNGVAGQLGTYWNFVKPPVTIRDGVVLSSGSVANLGPLAEVLDPNYDPAGPPAVVNSQMVPEPDTGGTSEFNAYGAASNNIENFQAGYDVAALRVDFVIDNDAQVQFDFIFGTVEYPVYTSSYTDAFLVFLDGTGVHDQITYDANNKPVQVGVSFAGLETTADVNTAFASPHALIHHLTTTTARLDAGSHTLIFEIGDVNDHILDSAVFISNLRVGTGREGTEPSEDPVHCGDADIAGLGGSAGPDGRLTIDDLIYYIGAFFNNNTAVADFVGLGGSHPRDGALTIDDLIAFLDAFFSGC
jgi:hypothetical protein